MDDINKGFVARNGFVEGSGGHLCLGFGQKMSAAQRDAVAAAFADTTSAAYAAAENYAVGAAAAMTLDYTMEVDTNSLTNMGANIVDALFGNGSYCESQPGADETSATYRIVGGANYQNFNNTAWTLGTSFAWSHDFYGYGPSSLGGFTEGRQSISLSLTARKGDAITTSVSYVDQLGDPTDNLRGDMDYVSANVSYAF